MSTRGAVRFVPGVLLMLHAAGALAAAPPPTEPPPVATADPRWNEPEPRDSAELEPDAPTAESDVDFALGAQVFAVSDKVMSGLVLRLGKDWFWGEFEFSPVWLTESSPDFDGSFLGNQWGFCACFAPVRTRHFELLAGTGVDLYHLWAVHEDELLVAWAFKLETQARFSENASAFATLRGYAVHSDGLELGTERDGSRSVPLLGSLGVEWRFR